MNQLDMTVVNEIKKLVVIAMVSDDKLMETLIFKGGSAIDMIYNVSDRASLDIDYSMSESISDEEIEDYKERISKALDSVFSENGYYVFDIKLEKRPKNLDPQLADFWGGFLINFKVVSIADAEKYDYDIKMLQPRSIPVGKRNSSTFKIDISSYEYCDQAEDHLFENLTVKVYSKEMIVFEKLRALCQQLPDYREIVRQRPRARGRDFYDIYTLMDQFDIDPTSTENIELIKDIFAAKKVPISFIKKLKESKEFHRENFEASLKDTISKDEQVKEFDQCFDFVIDTFGGIDF